MEIEGYLLKTNAFHFKKIKNTSKNVEGLPFSSPFTLNTLQKPINLSVHPGLINPFPLPHLRANLDLPFFNMSTFNLCALRIYFTNIFSERICTHTSKKKQLFAHLRKKFAHFSNNTFQKNIKCSH